MDRVKLAPVLFILAAVMFVLPFFTLTVVPSEDTLAEVTSGLQDAELRLSLTGLEMTQLTRAADEKDLKGVQKDLEKASERVLEPLYEEDEPSDEDIQTAISDFTKEAKAPFLVGLRYYLSEDTEFAKALEDAVVEGDEDQQALLDQVTSIRSKLKTVTAVLMVALVLLAAAAVLGFMSGGAGKYSLYAGAAAAVALIVVAVLSMAKDTVEIGSIELFEYSLAPGIGLIVAVLAAAAGSVLALRSGQTAVPVYAAPYPAPMPMETLPVETLPVEPIPAPVTAATIMEAPATPVPVWGATVIEDTAAAPGVYASLRVVAGAGMGRGYDIRAEGETRLGRDAAMNDIVVSDAKASGQHAKIRYENNGFTLFDLGSTNGTYVNDAQVLAPVVLKMDDRVKIGDTIMVFQVAQA